MMSKGDILLTASDLLRWREEDKILEEEIRQKQQRRSELKRKLDAAEVFAEPIHAPSADGEAPEIVAPSRDGQRVFDEAESPPQALRANLLKTGDSLNI